MKEETEAQLFDFIENRDFSDLSAKDQAWVLEYMTRDEYEFQRTILLEPMAEAGAVVAPLIIPQKTRVLTLIFTSVTSAAAAVIAMFFLMDFGTPVSLDFMVNVPNVKQDTLFVENTLRVTDTVVEFLYLKGEPSDCIEYTAEEFQLPEYTPVSISLPEIRKEDLVNIGNYASKDARDEKFRSGAFIGM